MRPQIVALPPPPIDHQLEPQLGDGPLIRVAWRADRVAKVLLPAGGVLYAGMPHGERFQARRMTAAEALRELAALVATGGPVVLSRLEVEGLAAPQGGGRTVAPEAPVVPKGEKR